MQQRNLEHLVDTTKDNSGQKHDFLQQLRKSHSYANF